MVTGLGLRLNQQLEVRDSHPIDDPGLAGGPAPQSEAHQPIVAEVDAPGFDQASQSDGRGPLCAGE
jgi:hypothetical protein